MRRGAQSTITAPVSSPLAPSQTLRSSDKDRFGPSDTSTSPARAFTIDVSSFTPYTSTTESVSQLTNPLVAPVPPLARLQSPRDQAGESLRTVKNHTQGSPREAKSSVPPYPFGRSDSRPRLPLPTVLGESAPRWATHHPDRDSLLASRATATSTLSSRVPSKRAYAVSPLAKKGAEEVPAFSSENVLNSTPRSRGLVNAFGLHSNAQAKAERQQCVLRSDSRLDSHILRSSNQLMMQSSTHHSNKPQNRNVRSMRQTGTSTLQQQGATSARGLGSAPMFALRSSGDSLGDHARVPQSARTIGNSTVLVERLDHLVSSENALPTSRGRGFGPSTTITFSSITSHTSARSSRFVTQETRNSPLSPRLTSSATLGNSFEVSSVYTPRGTAGSIREVCQTARVPRLSKTTDHARDYGQVKKQPLTARADVERSSRYVQARPGCYRSLVSQTSLRTEEGECRSSVPGRDQQKGQVDAGDLLVPSESPRTSTSMSRRRQTVVQESPRTSRGGWPAFTRKPQSHAPLAPSPPLVADSTSQTEAHTPRPPKSSRNVMGKFLDSFRNTWGMNSRESRSKNTAPPSTSPDPMTRTKEQHGGDHVSPKETQPRGSKTERRKSVSINEDGAAVKVSVDKKAQPTRLPTDRKMARSKGTAISEQVGNGSHANDGRESGEGQSADLGGTPDDVLSPLTASTASPQTFRSALESALGDTTATNRKDSGRISNSMVQAKVSTTTSTTTSSTKTMPASKHDAGSGAVSPPPPPSTTKIKPPRLNLAALLSASKGENRTTPPTTISPMKPSTGFRDDQAGAESRPTPTSIAPSSDTSSSFLLFQTPMNSARISEVGSPFSADPQRKRKDTDITAGPQPWTQPIPRSQTARADPGPRGTPRETTRLKVLSEQSSASPNAETPLPLTTSDLEGATTEDALSPAPSKEKRKDEKAALNEAQKARSSPRGEGVSRAGVHTPKAHIMTNRKNAVVISPRSLASSAAAEAPTSIPNSARIHQRTQLANKVQQGFSPAPQKIVRFSWVVARALIKLQMQRAETFSLNGVPWQSWEFHRIPTLGASPTSCRVQEMFRVVVPASSLTSRRLGVFVKSVPMSVWKRQWESQNRWSGEYVTDGENFVMEAATLAFLQQYGPDIAPRLLGVLELCGPIQCVDPPPHGRGNRKTNHEKDWRTTRLSGGLAAPSSSGVATHVVIVSELYGEDLLDFLERREKERSPLTDSEKKILQLDCLMLLKRLHDLGLAHLDFTPENVLHGRRGLRLCDFAKATPLHSPRLRHVQQGSGYRPGGGAHTKSNAAEMYPFESCEPTVGKGAYMPPECWKVYWQLEDTRVQYPLDELWSLTKPADRNPYYFRVDRADIHMAGVLLFWLWSEGGIWKCSDVRQDEKYNYLAKSNLNFDLFRECRTWPRPLKDMLQWAMRPDPKLRANLKDLISHEWFRDCQPSEPNESKLWKPPVLHSGRS